MPTLERVREDIREIAGRTKGVRFEEIERIVNQLGALDFETGHRKTRHGHLFRVANQKFGVCAHNRGRTEVKEVYVLEFLDAMQALGLYEE